MSRASIELGGIQMGTSPVSNEQSTSSTTPFHAVIMSNFSGSREHTTSFKPRVIDRDTFDQILESINPSLSFPLSEDQNSLINLTFKELEDFEPDALYNSLDIFSDLRALRRRLSNNASFEAAAREMNAWQENVSTNKNMQKQTVETPQAVLETEASDGGSFLDSLISETEQRQEDNIKNAGENLAQSLIQQIVAPYVLPSAHPQQAALVSAVDDSITGLMNTILHHPEFQALESGWRGLYQTIRNVKTNSNLKLFYVDVSKGVLEDSLKENELETTPVFKQMIEPFTEIAGSKPRSVIVGDYYFGDTNADLLLLEKLGLLAKHANATFVAAAKPEVIGATDLGKQTEVDNWTISREPESVSAWQKLRELPQATNLALAFPRVIMRLPYGEKTKSIDSFNFEEMKGSEHSHYLWGNPAFYVLISLATSFEKNGWQFRPGEDNEIENLPAHHYEEDGDTELKACAETYLTEKSGERLLENGLLPIWSILRSDSARIGPYSSLHISNQRIRGRWQGD